jgi:hypothetical protein
MADSRLMAMWPSTPDEEGCFEFVVPNSAIYMLTPAHGETVSVSDDSGKLVPHDDVHWFLDFSRMVSGEISSARFVTTDELTELQAKEWALDVAGSAS